MPSGPAVSKAHGIIKQIPDTPSIPNEESSYALPGTHAPLPAKFPTHPPTPPPILKKPSATNGNSTNTDSSQKTARLFLTGLGGQHIRKPSSPLTPISPPPFAALPTDSAGSNTTHQSHQKRPHFVASKAGRRRPVLPRRKSSQTSVPSLLRSEVQVEPDVSKDCEGQGVVQEDKSAELCNNGMMKGEKPDPRDIRARVSEVCANRQQQGTSQVFSSCTSLANLISNSLSGLSFLVVPKTSKSNSKARPRYGGHPKTIPYAQASPTKLVDDHFRLRFAKEMQREDRMLKAVNSLPESERKAALERYTRALTGQEPPKQPKTAWLVVPDDEVACHEPESMSNNNLHDEWPSATDDETSNAWTPDDAQDYYPNTQVDAIPFKLEGMSYASSSRAASRLRAPGQLTVLLRAEQYGYCSDAGFVDST